MPKSRRPNAKTGATLTVNQAWEKIGKNNITRQAVYLAAERGDFPSIRLGRRILIPRHAFEEFLLGTQRKNESAA
jgi:excisionase family DNA binding protein